MTAGPADPKALQVLPSWVTGNPVPPGSRIGKILQNEYLLKGLLGEGELGVTYEAENTRLRGRFAVLMLKRELKPTQGMMLQVRDDLRKAEPLAKLGLMPVRMVTDQHQIPGFATELLEGETLRRRLQRGPMRVERALAVALQVARALEALHQAGAVHGDLRPENLFLVKPAAKSSYAGRVVIVEHSFYHLRRREPGLDDKLPLYKLMYRPPELLLGERGPHPGADVFDLGAILYEAITGKPAFYDEDPDFILDNLGQPPKPLEPKPESGLTPELASQITVLITSACARDPDERLPDMGEFIAAIEQIVRGSGLKLPDVVVEAPEAAPEVQAAPSNQRMARVLERRSGVFAIIAPPGSPAASEPAPPAGSPPAPVTPPRPAARAESEAVKPTLPPVSPAADAAVDDKAASEQKPATPSSPDPRSAPPGLPATITAPKNKVTRILQRLSGAFPVLTVSADGTHIEESLSRPSDPQLKVTPSAPPPPTGEPAAPPASVPPPTERAPAAASAPSEPAPAVAAEPPAAATAAPAEAPAFAAPTTEGSAAAAPAAAATPSATPSVTPAQAATAPAAQKGAEPQGPAPAAPAQAAASPTPVTASQAAAGPAAAPGAPPVAPARPAGIPADLARALLQSRQKSPQTPPGAEPAGGTGAGQAPPAVSPSPVSTAAPAAHASPAAADHPEAHKVTVPPVAPPAQESPAAPHSPAERAASAAQREAASGPPVSDSGGHGALAPTPPVLPALDLRSREVTLAGDELIEAAEPPQLSTLSEVPTRPALAAMAPPSTAPPPPVPTTDVPLAAPTLSPLLDQATQPALRRMPITEQATQARLPALDAISAQPTMAALPAELPPAVASSTPAATPPPSPPPSGEGLPTPRPPRVSQLIKALQRGEMDAVKAITEAARSHAASSGAVAAVPTASAAQPSVSGPSTAPPSASGPTTSTATPSVPSPSGPAQGRVSPGVMASPPLLPPSSSPEAAIATTQVDTSAKGLAPAETSLREFITRHQEALSMIAGAVLMLLVGLLVLSVLR